MKNNDLYYVCYLMESLARHLNRYQPDIFSEISLEKLKDLFRAADVHHCLPIEQVIEEIIDMCDLQSGDYIYKERFESVPPVRGIGGNLTRLVQMINHTDYMVTLYYIYRSQWFKDHCNYNTAMFYSREEFFIERLQAEGLLDENIMLVVN